MTTMMGDDNDDDDQSITSARRQRPLCHSMRASSPPPACGQVLWSGWMGRLFPNASTANATAEPFPPADCGTAGCLFDLQVPHTDRRILAAQRSAAAAS